MKNQFRIFCLLLLSFCLCSANKDERSLEREIPSMTLAELVDYWGYQFEEHHVLTSDGYILGIHRIPGAKNEGPVTESKPVALLAHGLLASSSQWIFGPAYNSMGYALADEGYDVWMVNTRGNSYSKNHTTFDTCSSCPDFWSYGFHEGGTKDFPAIIDYILEMTAEKDLFFVGHSMGTTQYLILLSDLPEYNAKIKAGFLLAPASFMTYSSGAIFEIAQYDAIEDLLHLFGIWEFLPHPDLIGILAHIYCNQEEHPIQTDLCAEIAFILLGINLEQLNKTMIPTYLDHHPAGTSLRPLIHFAQLNDALDRFVNYDFGTPEENFEHYGTIDPPVYDLSQVTAKTALYVGEADTTATVLDGEHLRDVLPNCIHYEVVDLPGCTHLDFALGVDARAKIYDPIMQVMAEILAEESK